MIRIVLKMLLVVLVFTEIAVRIAGIANTPLRDANNVNGYIPKASQSGRFLLNDWTINSMHMISSSEFSTQDTEVLIVGDSVVNGGNPLSQSERIGEQLNSIQNRANIYSIADGSWSFKNSLNYIEQHLARIDGTETIVFILNSGDFSSPTSWRCMSSHPTKKPLSHLYFVLRKYFFSECFDETPANLVVPDYEYVQKFEDIQNALDETHFIIFLFQNKNEYITSESLRNRLDINTTNFVQVYELIDFKAEWSVNFYADSIHPTAEGAAAFARILKMVLEK